MSGSTSGRPNEPRPKDFPSSKVHGEGNETTGPTPGHEDATDTNLAADERGEHSQLPVEGGAEVEETRPERRS